tara:strand:- start:439 stop:1320 length:882 start_codon:yes stop_codon:yes gene_type:complete
MDHARPNHAATSRASTCTDRQRDQFYTCDAVAAECYGMLRQYLAGRQIRFVEPSAGEGAFLKLLPPGSIGYDIEPKHPGIIEADFLQTELPRDGEIAIIGNPPFGKNSSLAVKFFNHAASQATIIGFILPRTFEKDSIRKRLNPFFHCVGQMAIPDKAFVFQGRPKSVPAVFQIWERHSEPRLHRALPMRHPDFEYTSADHADFVVQRIGKHAGRVNHDFKASPESHYFIRAKAEGVEAIMRSLDLETPAKRTAGNPSLTKPELAAAYAEQKARLNLRTDSVGAAAGQMAFEF